MIIDINKIDITDFNVRDCVVGGEECAWVFPKLEGTTWKQDNIHLRSSIWRKSDGKLISGGFKKFFNWHQNPDIDPAPLEINNHMQFVEKVDGSCLIVSKHNGELLTRTRRSHTQFLPNGDELEKVIMKKYPKAFDHPMLDCGEFSFLYEWITPSNHIVIRYPEPELRLIGITTHDDYSYWLQSGLDNISKEIGVPRPEYFKFRDLEEMFENVTKLKGGEGVCVYYGNGQRIRKCKSEWYNIIHCFRGEMSFKNIVDVYLEYGMPEYNLFNEIITEQFGWEGAEMAKALISSICDAKRESDRIVTGMKRFLNLQCDGLSSKVKKVEKIYSAYGKTNRADIVLTLLNGKQLDTQQWKKLLFQSMIAK